MRKLFIFFVLLFSLNATLFAQESVIYQTEEGAIKGYDPVAYFKDNKAVKGLAELNCEWNGAKWYFTTKENLKAFEKTPEKFAPQYGGYCAFGYSQGTGHPAPIEPTAFSVIDGKLYLNYNQKVQEMWNKDKPAFITKANENYKAQQMKIKEKAKQ